jgi:subtilisin family serine protease
MNMSVGGDRHAMLNKIVSVASNLGIIVVASAGNVGRNACNYSPGSATGVITVGATNKYDARPWYSNYGNCVSIFAPGDSIRSASTGSDFATSVRSGTSMAAPHVSGAAALYVERYPKLGPREIRQKILQDASQGIVTRPGTLSNNLFLQIL